MLQIEAGTGGVAQVAASKSGHRKAAPVIFDRTHLAQYTMDSPELEREISTRKKASDDARVQTQERGTGLSR